MGLAGAVEWVVVMEANTKEDSLKNAKLAQVVHQNLLILSCNSLMKRSIQWLEKFQMLLKINASANSVERQEKAQVVHLGHRKISGTT